MRKRLSGSYSVAEALAVYERARITLRDELGIPPGQAMQAIHTKLVAGQPARA